MHGNMLASYFVHIISSHKKAYAFEEQIWYQ